MVGSWLVAGINTELLPHLVETGFHQCRKSLQDFERDAAWRTDGEILVCEFKTMEFDVHSIDAENIVSAEPHRQTGPRSDGFIIRLSPLQKPYLLQPYSVYGLTNGPYWQNFFCVYDHADHAFRLDILYGTRPNKKLLNTVVSALGYQVDDNLHLPF